MQIKFYCQASILGLTVKLKYTVYVERNVEEIFLRYLLWFHC